MIKLKIFLLLAFLAISQNSKSSDLLNYLKGLKEFVTMVQDIDELLDGINEKEKLRKIDYLLGYASADIDDIAFKKMKLAEWIGKLDSVSGDSRPNNLKPLIDELIFDIDRLLDNLDKLKSAVSVTKQDDVDEIIQNIRSNMKYQKLARLEEIQKYLYGGNFDLELIKQDAEQAMDMANQASVAIKAAKKAIAEKLLN